MVKVCIGHTRSFLYDKGDILHRVCKTLPIYKGMLHCIVICYFCTLSPLYIQEKFCVLLRKASLIHIIYCSCHIKAVEFFNQSYWIHSHHIILLVINSLGDGDTRMHTYRRSHRNQACILDISLDVCISLSDVATVDRL